MATIPTTRTGGNYINQRFVLPAEGDVTQTLTVTGNNDVYVGLNVTGLDTGDSVQLTVSTSPDSDSFDDTVIDITADGSQGFYLKGYTQQIYVTLTDITLDEGDGEELRVEVNILTGSGV